MATAPLHIYISHASEDAPAVQKFLRWLGPMQSQYNLRIWFNVAPRPPIPMPLSWRLLLFWYLPPPTITTPWHPQIDLRISEAQIYLFFISHNSLGTPWIEEKEIRPAVQRHIRLGRSRVRIFPILVSPTAQFDRSPLSGFKILGPPKSLAALQFDDEVFREMIEELELVIEEMQRNETERQYLLSRPVQPDSIKSTPDANFLADGDPTPSPTPAYKHPGDWPLPDWMGWTIILLILWLTYLGIAPYLPVRSRMAEPFIPYLEEMEIEPENPKYEYIRENPLMPLPSELDVKDTTEWGSK